MGRLVKRPGGCWEWPGSKTNTGFGRVKVGSTRNGGQSRAELVHRVVFAAVRGVDLGRAHVMHTCDNPACANPAHLRLGDAKANAEDRERKGRGNPPKGEGNGRAILTRPQVDTIRARSAAGERGSALAAEYGVSRETVYALLHYRSWR